MTTRIMLPPNKPWAAVVLIDGEVTVLVVCVLFICVTVNGDNGIDAMFVIREERCEKKKKKKKKQNSESESILHK